MSPDEIDIHLDAILRAAGSGLRNYTLPSTVEAMRAAMRKAVGAAADIGFPISGVSCQAILDSWTRIEEGAEVDVPLDTDVLLAWWDEWSEQWRIEANHAGSERGGWRHGRATHWMPLPAPPARESAEGGEHGR